MRRTVTAVFALTFAAACGRMGEHAETRIERSWSAAEIRQLSVRSVHSEIRVVAGSGDQIRMRADVRIDAPEAKRLLERGPLSFRVENGVLTVSEESYRRKRSVLPWLANFNQQVDYRFEVPASMKLAVTNVSGSIDVEGIEAESDIQSVNGGIDFQTRRAPLVARTVNGSIDARFTDAFSGAKLRTVNGPVNVEVPGASDPVCKVSQVNGGFESNIPVTLSRGGKHAVTSGSGSELEVTTVNGDITLMKRTPPVPPTPPTAVPSAPVAPAAPAAPSADL